MKYVLDSFMKELTVLLTQTILVMARTILVIAQKILSIVKYIFLELGSILSIPLDIFLGVNALLIVIHLSLFSLLIHFKLANDFFVVFDILIQQSSPSAKDPSVSRSVESAPSTFRGDELRPIGWYQNILLTFVQDDLSPAYSFFWSELKKEEKGGVPGFIQQSNADGGRNPEVLFSYSTADDPLSSSGDSSKDTSGRSGECRFRVDENNWEDEGGLGWEEYPLPCPSQSDLALFNIQRPSMEEVSSD